MSPEVFSRRAILVPFEDKGRSWAAWDCWGMLRLFYREVLGVDLASFVADYEDAGKSVETRRELHALMADNMHNWRQVATPITGDAVLLLISGRPIHVAVAVDAERILHTERVINTVIERLASPMWSRRIEGFYRYDG